MQTGVSHTGYRRTGLSCQRKAAVVVGDGREHCTHSRLPAPASRTRAFYEGALGTAAGGSMRSSRRSSAALFGGIARRGASRKQRP